MSLSQRVLVCAVVCLGFGAIGCGDGNDDAEAPPVASGASSETDMGDADVGDEADAQGAVALAFSTDQVQSLLVDQCGPCHTSGPTFPSVNDVGALVGLASTIGLPHITAGDRARSYLYHKMAGTQLDVGGGGSIMPIGRTPTSPEDLESLGLWIDGL